MSFLDAGALEGKPRPRPVLLAACVVEDVAVPQLDQPLRDLDRALAARVRAAHNDESVEIRDPVLRKSVHALGRDVDSPATRPHPDEHVQGGGSLTSSLTRARACAQNGRLTAGSSQAGQAPSPMRVATGSVAVWFEKARLPIRQRACGHR